MLGLAKMGAVLMRDGQEAGLRRRVEVFLLAVQFLTRLPVPRDLPWSEARQAEAMAYLPLVGLCVGGIGALVLWGAALVFPMPVAVLMSLAATLLVTGAFHEDGLADAADGLGGGVTRERALEIMRDSRIGSYGAVSLGIVLALKVAGLVALPLWMAVAVLALGHGISRYGAVLVMFRADYARVEGAKFAAPRISAGGMGWRWPRLWRWLWRWWRWWGLRGLWGSGRRRCWGGVSRGSTCASWAGSRAIASARRSRWWNWA
ncbi:hypothetical protein MACH21_18450 [Roseicyclus marinus]|uniref:Adenosylcobinamide-GDP ribazoletransferase n=1 Tax=Roseicyclus marinus TaxID=2161673 RepID=A0AA48HA23_9RHOB|nr:hypothetical protein MACH21_18450 [Roseicyclus marinus]